MPNRKPSIIHCEDSDAYSLADVNNGGSLFASLKARAEQKTTLIQESDKKSRKKFDDRRQRLSRLEQCFSGSMSSLEVDLTSDDEEDASYCSEEEPTISRFSASPRPSSSGCFDSIPELPESSDPSILQRRNSISGGIPNKRRSRTGLSHDEAKPWWQKRSFLSGGVPNPYSSPTRPSDEAKPLWHSDRPLGPDDGVMNLKATREGRWCSDSLRVAALKAMLDTAGSHNRMASMEKATLTPPRRVSECDCRPNSSLPRHNRATNMNSDRRWQGGDVSRDTLISPARFRGLSNKN
jgi:hypothetical protein